MNNTNSNHEKFHSLKTYTPINFFNQTSTFSKIKIFHQKRFKLHSHKYSNPN